MKNKLTVRSKTVGNRLSYCYEVEGPWREAFNINGIEGWFATVSNGIYEFFIEYDESVETVPKSIAVIPFICNVLPIAWVYDAEVLVEELDLDFYNSIKEVKKGYQTMYPTETFGGRIIADTYVRNEKGAGGSFVFFSGGVDANFTLVSKLDEKPILATIWGSDIFFKSVEEWGKVYAQNKATADSLKLPFMAMKSSFRLFINYTVLDRDFGKRGGSTSWWHGFQHGIGIIGHAAPIAWLRGVDKVYISSSYSYKDGDIKCASYPSIDEKVRFCGAEVSHYDFYVTRQQKVAFICETAVKNELPISLRVCWQAGQAQNCGRCEKCVRTIFSVQAAGHDPNQFGFMCTDTDYEKIEQAISTRKIKPTKFWAEIVQKFKADAERWNDAPHVRALLNVYSQIKS